MKIPILANDDIGSREWLDGMSFPPYNWRGGWTKGLVIQLEATGAQVFQEMYSSSSAMGRVDDAWRGSMPMNYVRPKTNEIVIILQSEDLPSAELESYGNILWLSAHEKCQRGIDWILWMPVPTTTESTHLCVTDITLKGMETCLFWHGECHGKSRSWWRH